MKYYLITFGCQINQSDSERIAAVLQKSGYQKTSETAEADLIAVNMCSVRQSAVDRVYGLARAFKKLKIRRPKLKTILTGCVLMTDVKKLKNQFDYILAIKTLSSWPQIIKKKSQPLFPKQRSPEFCQKQQTSYFKNQPVYSHNFSAFIPITTGCDNFCSYCVVPYTRGSEISRPAEEIIQEAKKAIKNGAKEIWLLGQNVNSYSWNIEHKTWNKIDFPKLLKMVNSIPGNFWIRFLSSHPKDFSDELIKTIKQCRKITPYISLPIQSGDNEILKRMNRPYTINQYKELVKKIRREIPDVFLSTDVIVGFPGETKAQFEKTLKLFKQIKFDMAYIAEYSPRPGTAAAKLKDNVSLKEKQKRREALTRVLKQTALESKQKQIGKTIEILTNEIIKNRFLVSKSRRYDTVKFQISSSNPQDLLGRFVKVKITDAMPWGLKGQLERGLASFR